MPGPIDCGDSGPAVGQTNGAAVVAGGSEPLRFVPHDTSHEDAVVEFLTASDWPFHPEARLDADGVRRRAADGWFDTGEDRECWWALRGGERVGLAVIFDLADPTPMFDLRIAGSARGRGYGTETVRWLTARVFTSRPATMRVEATTRADNWPMRAVFARCGYAKEAHYRQAWTGADSTHDAVGYAILRADWQTGTTTPFDWANRSDQRVATGSTGRHQAPLIGFR